VNRLLFALLLCAAFAPVVAASPLPEVPPAFDALLARDHALPVGARLPADVQRRFETGRLSGVEERLGLPTFFWAPRTPREGTSLAQMGLSAAEAARQHLLAWGPLYGQTGAELAESTLHRVHDTGRGAVIVSFRKQVDGVRVFRDELRVVMDRNLELVALSGYLPPHARAGLRGVPQAFHLGHATAVAQALSDLTGMALESSALVWDGRVVEDYHHFHLGAGDARARGLRFSQPARARAVLFTLPEGLVPAYYVELDVGHVEDTRARMAGYVISAHDGALLFRKDHTANEAFAYRVWADADGLPWDGPQGTQYSPHPTGTPDGQLTQLVPQDMIVLESGPLSSNDPWLAPGAVETRGNNVDAYADLSGPDGFGAGDIRPQVTSPGTFDFPYDLAAGPQTSPTQIAAAATMLFVANNFFHDWYYDAGFNEAAGNAQTNNYGRGGLGNDSLRVEAQDYSGQDNANMATPSDGGRPRMQMFIFRGAATQHVTLTTGSGSTSQYNSGAATFGPTQYDVTAAGIRSQPTDACSPLTNAADLVGKVVVIDRGTCTFVQKAKAAQNAGAVAVIIANNQSGGAIQLPGTDATIVIPTVSVSQTSGNTLKGAIGQGPVTLRVFRQANPDRDGTLDNQIVAHEWGHYISNRLIGDANGLNNTQGWGMGEGWGDFHALLMTVRESDAQLPSNVDWKGVYPMSTFVTTMAPGQGLYFGIRRVPYSINFSKNALTFKHIQNGVPLPSGVPTAFGSSGNNNAEVHATGEVWATMLWEAYAALLKDSARLSFDAAQDKMRRYLVAGYKGTPNSPTFTEARDAILAAALAEDEADYQLIWQAFARRGAGLDAVSPNRASSTNSPVVEDFNAGNALTFVRADLDDSVLSCDQDGLLDNGETGQLVVTVRNSGVGTLKATVGTVVSETTGLQVLGEGVLDFGDIPPFGVVTREVQVQLEGMTDTHELRLAVTLQSPDLGSPQTSKVGFRGNVDELPASSTIDDVESENTLWLVAQSGAFAPTAGFERQALGAVQHQWFGPNPAQPADLWLVSPTVDVAPTGNLVISFRHRYDLEASNNVFYDGAVLEMQVVGTAGWMDIGTLASQPYDGTLAPSPSANPLRGRPAWSGKSPGYPAYTQVNVNLGADYAGKRIRIRFRLGGDNAVAHKGWELDDIGFHGIVGSPFSQVVPQVNVCGNATPVVDVGPHLEVDERAPVDLVGLATDDDGDPLTFTWSQLEGPAVTLSDLGAGGARFLAPEVTLATLLRFELAVTDGKVTVRKQQHVTVLDVNRPPVAVPSAQSGARAGDRVTVDGSSSTDPDGDAIVGYEWLHVDGPPVVFEGQGAQVSFLAPPVDTRSVVRLALVVSDGDLTSDPVTFELEVEPRAAPAPAGCGCAAGGAGAGVLPLWLAMAGLALGARRRMTRRRG
jgi:MYXO-CTERM domain-containing protein